MPHDDDDDLFSEEFDFVDEDDDDLDAKSAAEDKGEPKIPRRGRGKDKADAEKSEKSSPRGPKRPRRGEPRREPRRDAPETKPPAPPQPSLEPAPVGYLIDDALDDEPSEGEAEPQAAAPTGPPADHVVHIYEYGAFKRTIPRKFTDEEAVSFAEEFTRTGKPYGRYAIATPEDEEPAATFAGAAKG